MEPTEAGDCVRCEVSCEKKIRVLESPGVNPLRECYLKSGVLYDPVHYLDRYINVSACPSKVSPQCVGLNVFVVCLLGLQF
jgi:hypothetical protein